jgi:hypothetical protein
MQACGKFGGGGRFASALQHALRVLSSHDAAIDERLAQYRDLRSLDALRTHRRHARPGKPLRGMSIAASTSARARVRSRSRA